MMSKKQTTTSITYEGKEKIISYFSKVNEIKFLRLEIHLVRNNKVTVSSFPRIYRFNKEESKFSLDTIFLTS